MAKRTTEEFIRLSKEVHGEKYKYLETDYKGSKLKLIITCSIHGNFEQRASSHLSGLGCHYCSAGSNRSDTKNFVERSNKVHNDKYAYNKSIYVEANANIIITCSEHGDFEQKAMVHLNGHGCSICAAELKSKNSAKTLKDFIKEAKLKHGDKYNYSTTKYKNGLTEVIINCPTHGDFEQLPKVHVRGSGCPKCSTLNMGFTRTGFKNLCKKNNKGLGRLYFIRCFNETESFYKIGITSNTIKVRFCGNISMPYNYEVLKDITGDPIEIFDLENRLLKEQHKYKYQPKISFGGETECFTELP